MDHKTLDTKLADKVDQIHSLHNDVRSHQAVQDLLDGGYITIGVYFEKEEGGIYSIPVTPDKAIDEIEAIARAQLALDFEKLVSQTDKIVIP